MELPANLIRQYLGRREKDIEDCAIQFEQKNFAYFQRLGHQLKGNAVTYGFPDLGKIGAEMEEAARLQNWELIQDCCRRFKVFIASIPK